MISSVCCVDINSYVQFKFANQHLTLLQCITPESSVEFNQQHWVRYKTTTGKPVVMVITARRSLNDISVYRPSSMVACMVYIWLTRLQSTDCYHMTHEAHNSNIGRYGSLPMWFKHVGGR